MIRRWARDDAEASFGVFHDAVHQGAGRHYSAGERRAWVPSAMMPEGWPDRLAAQTAWVSEDDAGLTGIISLADDGYLDVFFVVPRARGNGTAVRLYDTLIEQARAQGHSRLTTHASLFLRPFLKRRGWDTLHGETVSRDGEYLRRFAMAMTLDQSDNQVS